ncbi:hypothetical protein CALVIDRAFT_341190 [Calocera viscosa TUFC12733]|uniref:Uncharacterized protein n=1 Tax=Calocera viscosa (strain TUFC12733) TaxID=1330018 RepID=A0A167HE99_CALVF|nr:hypothetical protein CALVIDRAFT_341190 [Calocera viscosa TUFC12733]
MASAFCYNLQLSRLRVAGRVCKDTGTLEKKRTRRGSTLLILRIRTCLASIHMPLHTGVAGLGSILACCGLGWVFLQRRREGRQMEHGERFVSRLSVGYEHGMQDGWRVVAR